MNKNFAGCILLEGHNYEPLLNNTVRCVRGLSDKEAGPSILIEIKGKGNSYVMYKDTDELPDRINSFYIGSGPSFDTPVFVPSMNKSIREIVNGYMEEVPETYLSERIKNLNHITPDAIREEPFRNKAQELIFNNLIGCYSAGLFLHGSKTTIILAQRYYKEKPCVVLVIGEGSIALMWFSSVEIRERFSSKKGYLTIPLLDIENSVSYINSLHLISKWAKLQSLRRNSSSFDYSYWPLVIAEYVNNRTIPIGNI